MAATAEPKQPGAKLPCPQQPEAEHSRPVEWAICPPSQEGLHESALSKIEPRMELAELICSTHCSPTQQRRRMPCRFNSQACLHGPACTELPLEPLGVVKSAFTTTNCDPSRQPLETLQTQMRRCRQFVTVPVNYSSVVNLRTKIDGGLDKVDQHGRGRENRRDQTSAPLVHTK